MPSRWVRVCRRVAPAPLRERAFDPAVCDLAQERMGRARRALAVLGIALECRRLHARSTSHLAPRTEHPALSTQHRSHGDFMFMTWLNDVRLAARRLRHQPLFTAVAVATLALGIGANVAVFTFVNAYLLAPLPVPAARELVRVFGTSGARGADVVSYPNYADLRDGATGVDLAAHVQTMVSVGDGDSAESRTTELVTGNYFRIMKLMPVAGRLLGAGDDVNEGAHPVVVLSEALWRARYGASSALVGQSILLNGAPYQVVGVVPAEFIGVEGTTPTEMWAPIMMQQQLRPRGNPLTKRGWGWLNMIGRRAPGVSLAAAQSAIGHATDDLNHRFPQKTPYAFGAKPAALLLEADRQALVPFASMTFAFTGLLLVVTCANLAGVMQARVVARRRELAIQQSLGAARGRLVSAWFTEAALLAAAGGAASLGVARLAGLAVQGFRPPANVRGAVSFSAPMDWQVIGFTALASIATAVFFGLLPALRAASAQPVSMLKEEGGTMTGGRRGTRMRRAAVVVQIAASGALLVASGLLVASLLKMQSFDPGFESDHVAMVSVGLDRQQFPATEVQVYVADLLGRARALPGVLSADVVANPPLTNNRDGQGFKIPGYSAPDGGATVGVDYNVVSASYFATMGLKFVRGRSWESPAFQPVYAAVINETASRRFFPGREPIGAPLEVVGQGLVTITGVVRDSAYYHIGDPPIPFVYLPAEAGASRSFALVARTSGPPADILPSLARVVSTADPRVKPRTPITFDQSRQGPLYPRRVMAWVASVFGALALFLTSVGLYGVVSLAVGQRTREIGVRIALGAQRSRVLGGVLRDALVIAAIGGILGGVAGFVLAGSLREWLFGVQRFDPAVYAGVIAMLALVAVVAAWMPARRAASIDPVVALRG